MDTIVIGITKMIGTGEAQTDWNLIMATTALALLLRLRWWSSCSAGS
jgi:sn-glycerol 3-phosphate transport system permease protein